MQISREPNHATATTFSKLSWRAILVLVEPLNIPCSHHSAPFVILPSDMPGGTTPDDFFASEFGEGDLATRLWRGGLRADAEGYSLTQGTRTLTAALKDGLEARDDGAVETLISDIEACWEDTGRLRRACVLLRGPPAHTPTTLVRQLLSVGLMQPPLATTIVNKLSELGGERGATTDLAINLLSQLRWLHFLVDGPALCDALLSVVPVVCPPLQRALVEALPEILDDAARPQAVTELVRILPESPSMMGSIIDALSSLGVDDDSLPDVNASIISTLPAASSDILPVCLRYLVRTCPLSLLTPTVTTLRNTLALPSLGPGAGKLCLDAVKTGLRLSKTVADHVLKTLRKLDTPEAHKPADWWIIMALFDSPLHRKNAEALFKRKAAAAVFTRAMVDAALAPFSVAFQPLSRQLVTMAGMALRASDVGARRTGVFLYAMLFRLFDSGDTRRNVVSSLLEHTGTRRPAEIDASLEAIALISRESENDRSLLPHSASIQGLLDFLESFSDSQIRQIWCILGHLCRASANRVDPGTGTSGAGPSDKQQNVQDVVDLTQSNDTTGEGELQMLEILLRKELTHPDTFYRRIGVIGACTMIKVLGNKVKNNILNMLLDVGRSHPLSQALAFDELSEVFGDGGPTSKDTAEYIRKTISTLFENRYIRDRSELGNMVKDEFLFPAELFGNLEGEDAEFCFSLSALIRNESTLPEMQDAVRAMIPNLRLLCVMTSSQYDGSLSEVDAIIGAPLHLPLYSGDRDMEDASTKSKSDLLLSLFIAQGWVVELINGFAEQMSAELRAKCVRRIDNLLELNSQISSVIPFVPLWREVLFDTYNGSHGGSEKQHSGLSGSGKVGAVGKKKKLSKDNSSAANARGTSEGGGEWKRLSRQLSPSALSLIRIQAPITFRYTETEESEFLREGDPIVEKASLSAKGLHYLLSELSSHIIALVGQKFKDPLGFGVTMFASAAPPPSKASESLSEAATDGPLKKLTALRVALESVGPQLERCLNKLFSPSRADEGDETSFELHRSCVILCLKTIAITLNSKILCDNIARDILFDFIASVRLDGKSQLEASEPLSTADIEVASKVAFEQLRRGVDKLFPDSKPDNHGSDSDDEDAPNKADQMGLEGCCGFLGAMNSLYIRCAEKDREELGEKFSKTALTVLKYEWAMSDLRQRKNNKLIAGLVRLYVQFSIGPLKRAEWLRETIVPYSERMAARTNRTIGTSQDNDAPNSEERASDLASLTAHTSHAYTVAILEQYLWLFKNFRPESIEVTDDAFTQMERFVRAEQPLYSLARHNQRALGVVMRAGRSLTELFLKHCVPFLKAQFRDYKAQVVQVCKLHQKPTRLLQTFCAHSKYIRDTSLTGLVPPLRRALELVLYRVKDVLQSHNATDAFELGNLKHRDINGEVLGSQQLQYKSDSSSSEEEDQAGQGEGENEDAMTDQDEDERERERTQRRAGRRSMVAASRGGGRGGKTRSRLTSARKPPRPPGRPPAAKRRKSGEGTAVNVEGLAREAQELDFGSDVDEKEVDGNEGGEEIARAQRVNAEEENEESDEEQVVKGRGRGGGRRVQTKARTSRAGRTARTARTERNVKRREEDVTQRARHRLIDDEAGEAESEDEEEGPDNLSQFLDFGDEEETEE